MGYIFPPKLDKRILQGVKVVNGEPHMKEDSEFRYVYGEPYINLENHEIVIR